MIVFFMTHALQTTDPHTAEPDATQPLRIVIAGGGTGGHLFPGIAIAQEFAARNAGTEVLFVSTGNSFERSVLSDTPFGLQTISAEGIKSRDFARQLKAIRKVPGGIIGSIRILKKFRPHLVIGVGSYSAGPVVFAAWLMNTRIVLHEQNARPGITNRILAGFATRIFISFEDRQGCFSPQKTVITGNPVRRNLLKRPAGKTPQEKAFTVLIIGGSQGAHAVNLAVRESLIHLRERDSYYFIHQTGARDLEMIKAAYRRRGIRSKVAPFFRKMDSLYREADLIICRAGATTIAEITAIGKGVIFIPFPFAADNHQVANARMLCRHGAAEMIQEHELSGRRLAERIAYYASAPDALAALASRAKSLGRPEAGRRIVDHCYRLIRPLKA